MRKKYAVVVSLIGLIILFIIYKTTFNHPKVDVVKIERGNLLTVIYATGTVTADTMATLRCEAGGIVNFVKPHEGSAVRKGELLLKTDQADQALQLQQSQNDLQTAIVELEESSQNLERSVNLNRTNTITKKELDDAKSAYKLAKLKVEQEKILVEKSKENLSKTEVYAPFSGIIVSVQSKLGDNLEPNGRCFDLISPSSILVSAEVDEQDLSRLSLNQKCVVAFDAYSRDRFNGYVYRIVPKTNEDTKTNAVYIKLKEKPANLNIGMTATVNIEAGVKKDVLLIPRTSILKLGNSEYVFAVRGGRLVKTEVKVGAGSGGKFTNLISGNLLEGDLIAETPEEQWTEGMKVDAVKR